MPLIVSRTDRKRKLDNSGEGIEDFLHGLLVAFCNGGEGEVLFDMFRPYDFPRLRDNLVKHERKVSCRFPLNFEVVWKDKY
jgi:hypothetical protein